jgi:PAS domain S-box-containing protein
MTDKINYLKLLFESGENIESFNQKINDFFPAVIYVYDPANRKLRYINKHLTQTLGFSYEELSASEDALMDLIFKDDVDLVKGELEKFHSMRDDESLAYGCRLNHKKGNWRYFKTLGTVLRRDVDGKAASLLFIAQDITDQLKSEEETAALRELFAETEDMLQFGSWNWDEKQGKAEWTRGVYNIFEYDPAEVKAITREFYRKHISEDDLKRFDEAVEKATITKSSFEVEYLIATRLGKQKVVSTKGKVITDDRGEVHRIVGITRDITAVRNFEKERERSIRELNRSNKELEEFAYVASHDLQEPLRKISTFTERIRTKYADNLGAEGSMYLERILAGTENMRILIDNLLEFSRTTRSSRQFEHCDLNAIIQQVRTDLELKIEDTGTEIKIQTLPTVEAVPTEMSQLFNNLISNSIKFRRQDVKPVISILAEKVSKSEKDKLHLPLELNYFKIVLRDNGIGFEPEYEEKIFQIFQRLHGKTEYAGSGIGLAICKKIVDNHEGVIYAQGNLGKGSTFTVVLPEKQRT